jgi:hypothetical protein
MDKFLTGKSTRFEESDLESRRQQKSESQSQDGECENYGDEPDFSDSEDFEDDITDEG